MNKENLNILLRYLLLCALQLLVLNRINVWGFATPYAYVLFLVMLPAAMNPARVMLWSFLAGITIDLFAGTGGLHAFALVFAAYARAFYLKLVFREPDSVTIKEIKGTYKGFLFILLVTCTHNLVLYAIEIMSVDRIPEILFESTVNTLVTLPIELILLYLIAGNKNRSLKAERT